MNEDEKEIELKPLRFELASCDDIDKFSKAVSAFIKMLGKYMGWGDDDSNVFVSDMSTLGDFGLSDEDLAALSQDVGFNLHHEDYIKDIAARMSGGW